MYYIFVFQKKNEAYVIKKFTVFLRDIKLISIVRSCTVGKHEKIESNLYKKKEKKETVTFTPCTMARQYTILTFRVYALRISVY